MSENSPKRKKELTPQQIQHRQQIGKEQAAKAGSAAMSERGKKGYLKSLQNNPDFHILGGQTTAHLYLASDHHTGEIGYEVAVRQGYQPKGKKHRYLGSCTCCKGRSRNRKPEIDF